MVVVIAVLSLVPVAVSAVRAVVTPRVVPLPPSRRIAKRRN
jgi:hypothetical protein